MIYFEGINSIIESVYLEDSLSNKSSNCDVFINPESTNYLVGKIVIINALDYPIEKINTLIKNNCRVISRIYIDHPEIEVRPYILRINFGIMWNGVEIKTTPSISKLIEDDLCKFSLNDHILYFPKIYPNEDFSKDSFGNLTGLGWALQQVGINLIKDTVFNNLDIIKLKKVTL